jgi:hypothetical protein
MGFYIVVGGGLAGLTESMSWTIFPREWSRSTENLAL